LKKGSGGKDLSLPPVIATEELVELLF